MCSCTATADIRIADFAVRTELDANYHNAQLLIKPNWNSAGNQNITGWTVQAQLYNPDGTPVWDKPLTRDAHEILNPDFSDEVLNKRNTSTRSRRIRMAKRNRRESQKMDCRNTMALYRCSDIK